ncbi:hypothetical protein ElyMa_003789300 [Elysia marginata]|uniref:Uncharacterized protein n=1 Tax=Elysia marginata TaxID=1093978 RepID=A0AAV4FBF1_9GAST|nr:hypothetical protein ElyMa_003789300 [Elysia marginata]
MTLFPCNAHQQTVVYAMTLPPYNADQQTVVYAMTLSPCNADHDSGHRSLTRLYTLATGQYEVELQEVASRQRTEIGLCYLGKKSKIDLPDPRNNESFLCRVLVSLPGKMFYLFVGVRTADVAYRDGPKGLGLSLVLSLTVKA